jgi:predicted component of type VI protein secretion system
MWAVSANRPAEADSVSNSKARVEAERAGPPFLLFSDDDRGQQLFFFPPGSSQLSVGRGRSSDVLLDWDDQVSRLHARFERVGNDWEVVDDGLSSNGTFVNQARLSGRRRLIDGDCLRFGTTTVTFRWSAPGPSGTDDAAGAPAVVDLSTTQRRVLVALCRPCKGKNGFASPATDQQIADELFLSVGAVKAHLSVLSAKLGVDALPENETRARLVERGCSAGLVSDRDL